MPKPFYLRFIKFPVGITIRLLFLYIISKNIFIVLLL